MASKKKAEDSNPTQPKAPRSKKPAAPRDTGRSKQDKPVAGNPVAAVSSAPAVKAPTGKVVVERTIGGRTLTLETGRMAKLSDGAVVARYGDTMVLATVNSQKAMDGIDFFPLTVDYREKTSAIGVIPGGFFKREGRPSTKEILACRIIDRSIRPMFPDGFKREVQVLSQVMSADRENDPDVLAAIASFAALAVSSVPNGRTLGMVRIGCVDDKLVVNPLWSQLQSENNKLNLTVAGHADAIAMVEAGAKEVSEEMMLEALELAHENCKVIAEMIDELAAKAGKTKMAFTPPQNDPELVAAIEDEFGSELRKAPLTIGTKQTRSAAIKAAKEKAQKKFHAPHGASESEQKAWSAKVSEILGDIVKDAERQSILKGTRADGRDHTTVRPITIEVGVLPRVHGSVLFTRGETQALGVVTLGGTDDQQIIDGLMPEPRKRFLLHYNFPPFSVGEVKRVGTPGRREIGHGALAERGLESVLPSREEFPYTIRITSEILESNGSSSMATACSGTLAMMDAGVPIKQPVAGIAMGLVMEGKKYAILTDILGSEDACGDMDFKVVGTGRGITALQMDIKCEGLTREIMAQALEQAKQGRLHVLREMLKSIAKPRQQLSPNAPRLESLQVPNEKIGLIIGPGGKNIRAMQENFECKISIEDGGMCTVTGTNSEKVMACVAHIKSMTAEVELGGLYEGRVTAIKEFGAFVEILPGQEGLVHVSELSDGFIRTVTDVVRIGDTLKVKVIAIDDFGKVKLSRKAVILAERGGAAPAGDAPAGGAPAAAPAPEARRPREDRPAREERGPREDRPMREERGPREDRPMREERGPREERPMREERGPRPEFGERGARPERGPREDRSMRDDRGPREERPMRDDRGPRPDRPMREERGPREERPMRDDRGPRPERPMREERPLREDRGPREERPLRDDRGPRPERPVREERGPREERSMRDDRGPRADRPMRDERAPREERPMREDRGPRPERPVRDERAPREERPMRGFGDEPARPERGGMPPRDRGPETGPRREEVRGERRPMRDAAVPPVRDLAPPTRDVAAPRDRGERADRPERGERPDRGGRDRGARMPMADFDDAETPPARTPRDEVGQLESLDSVLGDDRGGPRRDRRRPRRDA